MFHGLALYPQQTEELQKQLQQLKQQYEQTTLELQQRIAALQERLKKENQARENSQNKEGAGSAVELAAQEAYPGSRHSQSGCVSWFCRIRAGEFKEES